MKKTFTMLLVAAIMGTGISSAQVTSHSSNDANMDGAVDVSDVTNVLSEMYGTATEIKQVVTAEDLNTLLQSINDKLSSLDSRMSAIEAKLGIVTPEPEPEDTHAYVDLGLPSGTLWATCNVGADSPEDYGDYFAWGETTPQSDNTYSWSSYKWCNGSSSTMTKYCTSSSYGTVDNKTELEATDDAATANWGSNWQMPSDDQMTELRTNCTWTWTTQNGVYGRKVTGTNGNSIFLPAAGYRYGSYLDLAGSDGYYWSSELDSNYSGNAWLLYFYSSRVSTVSGSYRYYGQSVRPVRTSAN